MKKPCRRCHEKSLQLKRLGQFKDLALDGLNRATERIKELEEIIREHDEKKEGC